MKPTGRAALLAALLLFAIYFANVALGAFAQAAFLDDVAEMLTLFASSVAFVAGVLMREARRNEAAEERR